MAGAVRGLEVISPEIIDGVARECTLPEALAPPLKSWGASA
jgi:hypothetical protein